MCTIYTIITGRLRAQNEKQQQQLNALQDKLAGAMARSGDRFSTLLERVAKQQAQTLMLETRIADRFAHYPTREQFDDAMDAKLAPINDGLARINHVIDDVLRSGILRRNKDVHS